MKSSILVMKKVTRTEIDNVATGLNARAARKAKGWTLKNVSELLGCSIPYVCDLECGARGWGGKIPNKYMALLAKK